ncbi:leucine-rich repeat-containing protein 49 isoform X3 [Osmerus eperlanus]|uniref:leucine-rich repeat-containing protein 49 isoform X3 n=1 Tax=Osmerus eperlanus TaxID=29151 RepID=UPI002E0FF05B
MRSQKHQANSSGRFLAPTVNTYKLHLAGVKSMIPDRYVRPLNIRLSKDTSKEINMDALRTSPLKQESKFNAHGRLHHTPVAFVNEVGGPERTLLPPAAAVPGEMTGELGTQAHRVKPRRATHSAGASYSHSASLLIHPATDTAGDVETHHKSSAPGFPIAFHSRDDCASSPERLDLDRRGLDKYPLLEGMDKLRLLNLQHNFITRVQNLSHLQCLVFLDLYDNRISEMTGISVLSSLRVLILGKNRIQRMCSLENLNQLDVLDLHGNQISRIENVSHLSELRVLNLASNNISRVDNLRGLDSLTELNLRRNCISAVTEVDQLPCLQRLFLSCNSISSFDDLGCLGESCSLSELTLDGNPVAQETWYKQATLRCLLQLRQLDMKCITEEERRMAFVLARKEEEKKKENSKQLSQKSPANTLTVQCLPSRGLRSQDTSDTSKEKRRLAIRNAAQQWEGLRACLELPSSQNGAKDEVSPENSPAHSPAQTNGLTLEPSPDEPRLLEAGGSSVQSLSLSDSHLAELDGDTLRLFGPGALEALERGWGVQTAGAVTVITFRYIHFDAIVPTLPRIRVKFPNLAHLVFLETSLSRLPQLAALAQVRRLDQLTIHPEGNPVVSLALWRSFLIYRLHHFNLQRVNGLEVTMNDVITAERLFGTLGHIAATETPRCRLLLLLEESRKRQLQFLLDGRGRRAGLSPEELRENGRLLGEGLSRALFNYPSRDCSAESPEEGGVESSERSAVAEQYLRELVQRASDTNLKGEALHKLWPSMFTDMVRDCVLEMKDQPAFRQASLARLSQRK